MKTLWFLVVVLTFGAKSVSAQDRGFLPTGYVFEYSYDFGFGPEVEREVSTNYYDFRGHLSRSVVQNFNNGQLYSSSTSTWKTDAQGRPVTGTTEDDWGGDGVVDVWSRSIYSFNQRGLVESVQTTNFDSSGIAVQVTSARYSYDIRGNLLTKIEEFHLPNNSSWDSQSVTTYTNDYRHNVQTILWQTFGADGTLTSSIIATGPTDKQGHVLSLQYSGINPHTGEAITRLDSFQYDHAGNLVESKIDRWEPNGLSGLIELILTTTYFYAHHGELVRNK